MLPHVVIVGGGFGGLSAARALRNTPVRVTLIDMGVLCERCRTVYFISGSSKSPYFYYDRTRGDFKLACDPPCGAVSYFHRRMMRPYSVSAETLERGFANIGECKPVSDVNAKDWA